MGVPCKKRPEKGGCGGEVLPAIGDHGTQCGSGRSSVQNEREEFAYIRRHTECVDQLRRGDEGSVVQRTVSQYQELRCVQPLGTDLRDGRCKRVHRQKHQSGENKFPTFNQHPTGYYNHTRRKIDFYDLEALLKKKEEEGGEGEGEDPSV